MKMVKVECCGDAGNAQASLGKAPIPDATQMIRLILPYPPSVNSIWRTPRTGKLAGRTLLSEKGRAYRKAVADAMWEQRAGALPLTQRLRVDIEARMPDRRRRDLDNIPKAVLDALTHAGVWHDDSQIDDLRVFRGPLLTGEIIVTIHTREA